MPLVTRGDPLGNGQAEPRAARRPGPGLVRPDEPVENVREYLRAYAYPVVGHGQPGGPFVAGRRNRDLAVLVCILDRVVHKDPQRLLDQGPVRKDSDAVAGNLELMPVVKHAHFADNFVYQRVELYALFEQAYPVAVAAREEQELLDEFLHVFCFVLYGRNRLGERLFVLLAPPVEQVGVALDDGNGGPELVRRVRDETGLRGVGLVDPVEHSVYRDRDVLELLLQIVDLYARVEAAGVDPVQPAGQRHHVLVVQLRVDGAETLRGLRQIGDGGQRLADHPPVVHGPRQKRERLQDEQRKESVDEQQYELADAHMHLVGPALYADADVVRYAAQGFVEASGSCVKASEGTLCLIGEPFGKRPKDGAPRRVLRKEADAHAGQVHPFARRRRLAFAQHFKRVENLFFAIESKGEGAHDAYQYVQGQKDAEQAEEKLRLKFLRYRLAYLPGGFRSLIDLIHL